MKNDVERNIVILLLSNINLTVENKKEFTIYVELADEKNLM